MLNLKTQNNNEDPKFEVGDHVRISKYKNIFVKGYVANWSEEVFEINICCGHMLLVVLTVKRLLERFTKEELQKTNQKGIRSGKVK